MRLADALRRKERGWVHVGSDACRVVRLRNARGICVSGDLFSYIGNGPRQETPFYLAT